MTTKSNNFFGYTQRMAGSPYQKWVLSPLPIPSQAFFTSTATGDIGANAIIPVTSDTINQVGGVINPDGTFSLPVGLYRIKFETTVTGTTEIVIGLNREGVTSVKSSSPSGTVTVSAETFVSCPGCMTRWSLVNLSPDEIATTMMGSYSVLVLIEKIY